MPPPGCPASRLRGDLRGAYLRFYLRPRVLLGNLRFFRESGGWRRLPYAASLWLREELR